MLTTTLGLLALVAVAAPGQGLRDLFQPLPTVQQLRTDETGGRKNLSDDAKAIGLTTERLVVAAESRLRGALVVHGRPLRALPVRECQRGGRRVQHFFGVQKVCARPCERRGVPPRKRGTQEGAGTHGRTGGAEFIVSGRLEVLRSVPDGIPAGERSRLLTMTFKRRHQRAVMVKDALAEIVPAPAAIGRPTATARRLVNASLSDNTRRGLRRCPRPARRLARRPPGLMPRPWPPTSPRCTTRGAPRRARPRADRGRAGACRAFRRTRPWCYHCGNSHSAATSKDSWPAYDTGRGASPRIATANRARPAR